MTDKRDIKPRVIGIDDCVQFVTKDGSRIREIMAPRNSMVERQSLAEAVVPVGGETHEHYHATSEEIYFMLSGEAEMWVEGETFRVRQGDSVALLPGNRHKIRNTGNTELVFLCICVPPYEHEDTVITEQQSSRSK